ncbi:hypothetical protein WBG83_05495 [Paenibacillus sp. y28]
MNTKRSGWLLKLLLAPHPKVPFFHPGITADHGLSSLALTMLFTIGGGGGNPQFDFLDPSLNTVCTFLLYMNFLVCGKHKLPAAAA